MNTAHAQQINPGKLKSAIEDAYANLDKKQAGKLLFNKDPRLWKTDAEQMQKISNRLGWLTLPDNADELINFSTQVKNEGFKYAVLLGMGGSSLCSEVARETFGAAKGYLELLVLDNTAPSAIISVEKNIEIEKTLFIVASKSGGTAETLSFFEYFYGQLEKNETANPGNNFVAITDAGTPLVKMAAEFKFRKVFINPSDIGGRYSVLSNFGLLPMALLGIDIKAMLASAAQMKAYCSPDVPAAVNPGIGLGAAMGAAQQNGRDKVTFVLSSSIKAFGYWVEQLIAESTGKEGKGLIPDAGELLGPPEVYQDDRIFVHIYLTSDDNKADVEKLSAIKHRGHPVVSIEVPDKIDLGAEYFRWEVATAIAGAVIGINPFDEPNVAEGKKNTNDILEEWLKNGSFKKMQPLIREGNISVYGDGQSATSGNPGVLKDFINSFTARSKSGDYMALLCYFEETASRDELLQSWRMQMRDHLKIAVTLGYGPRYLHSTGQLHKGGPDSGVYIIVVADEQADVPIPGGKYGFETLHQAQSLGDFRSLTDKGRRVIYIELGKNIDRGLKELYLSVYKA